ncbi:hypothetical protein EDB85DRAFT_1902370 [Lactarius pseudohatsudake]|nr:hypothetical protein EDB85DRAFT_1902370 [Lactarius pseudohatsudake]
MLPLILLRTLNGPIPTLFTGDPTHAVQFIEDLARLVWTNPDHPLVSTPWMRIDTALALISGPATLAWRRSIRCDRSTEATDTLWDDFLESFCETWVHSPESTVSVVAPAVQISTANIPSPSLAVASTLKRVEDISIILATDELSPQCLSGTIDLTADDDEADDWSLFAPCTSAPPPRNPHRPFSPRLASPITSILDLVRPVDEPPRLLDTLVHPAPVSPVPASTESREEDISIILNADEVPAVLFPTVSGAPLTNERALPTPPRTPKPFTAIVPLRHPLHAYALSRKREHEYDADDEHAYPRKHPHIQITRRYRPLPRQYRHVRRPIAFPPPVDDSSGLFTSARPRQSSPSGRLTTPRRAVLHNAISRQLPSRSFPATIDLAADDACNATDLAFFTHISSHRSSSHPCLPSPPVLTSPRTPFSGLHSLSPDSPLGLSLALDETPRLSSSEIADSTLDDIDNAANTVLFTSRPPSPSFTPTFPSTHPPASIVEDDNIPKRGVKTIENSVLIPLVPRYPPIFPRHALEMPRDPDEFAPTAAQNRDRVITTVPSADPTPQPANRTTSRPPNSRATRKRNGHTDTTRRTNGTATHASQEPAQGDRYRPYPRTAGPPSHPPRDLDKPTAESVHAQPRQTRSRRAPRPADHRINNEQTPDAFAKRRAVDTFLKNYDARVVQKPTPAKKRPRLRPRVRRRRTTSRPLATDDRQAVPLTSIPPPPCQNTVQYD